MYFWGIEVKSGEVVVVQPGDGMLLHISQACLEGIKKDKGEYVRLYAEKDGKKFLLGMLSPEKFPHLNFDVVFEDSFELSHDGKTECVHFAGYKAPNGSNDDEENGSDESDGEPVPIKALDNGTSVTKVDKPYASKSIAPSKPEAAAGKGKVKIVEPSKNAKQSEDSDSDDSEDSDDADEDDSDSAKPEAAAGKGKMKMVEPSKNAKQSKDSEDSDDSDSDSDSDSDEGVEGESEDDSSDDDSEEDESDKETPKKPESSKKRAAETSSKTSGPDKKAKFATPVKNEGKKPVPHVATPHPSKQAGKLPVNSDKSKQQSPKSGGSVICNSCSRTFGSDQALQSHSKAKHGAK